MELESVECLPGAKNYLGRYISILHRRSQLYLGRELAAIDLSAATYAPLLALYGRDGMSQEELARHVGVDKAAMKRSIDGLEAAGYVIREADQADRRAYKVRLTSHARDMRPQVEAVFSAWESLLVEGLDAAEVERLRASLKRMADRASSSITI
jgi:DNA-binding MarR family transcriptional regulator